jgi:hypothetical protein
MPELYKIRDWNRHFETSDSKRYKTVSWIKVQNKLHGRGLRRLLRLPDGAAVFGAFILICEVASTMPVRGILADEDGPLSVTDIADKLAVSSDLILRALDVCSSKGIGWIHRDCCESTGDHNNCVLEQNRTEQNRTEQNRTEQNRASERKVQEQSPDPALPVSPLASTKKSRAPETDPESPASRTATEAEPESGPLTEELAGPVHLLPESASDPAQSRSQAAVLRPEAASAQGEQNPNNQVRLVATELEELQIAMRTFAQHMTRRKWPAPDWTITKRARMACSNFSVGHVAEWLKQTALTRSPRMQNVAEVRSYGFVLKLIEDEFGGANGSNQR